VTNQREAFFLPLTHNRSEVVHPKFRNINLHNVIHSRISRNPRERMFVVQISLLIVTFFSLISHNLSLMQTTKEVTHILALRHVSTCGVSPSYSYFFSSFLMPLVECWCMRLPHRMGAKWRGPH
jgi:hypothetical protein